LKQKIALVIGSDFHARSIYSGNLLPSLENEFCLVVIHTSDVKYKDTTSEKPTREVRLPRFSLAWFPIVLDANLVRHHRRSRSFHFRIRRRFLGDYKERLPISFRGTFGMLRAIVTAVPGIYGIVNRIYSYTLSKSKGLVTILAEEQPDIILAWAQSSEPTVVSTILAANRLNIPNVIVFDNWDNLSSKGKMVVKPDFVVCFGKQSQEFASRIHGLDTNSVLPLGTARFDGYVRKTKQNSSARETVLIAGSSISLEDYQVLKLVQKWSTQSKATKSHPNLQIVYRSHPAPQGPSLDYKQWEFSDINIDDTLDHCPSAEVNWPNQDEIVESLYRHKIVIAGPTTLLLEALLSGCWVIIPALYSKRVRTSTRLMLKKLEHLEDIEKVTGIDIAFDERELFSLIEMRLKERQSPPITDELLYRINCKDEYFSEKLIRSCRDIIQHNLESKEAGRCLPQSSLL
jgi:hypothetical protein